jgi:hypothetical protein
VTKKLFVRLGPLLLAGVLSGCTTTPLLDFTVISTRSLPSENLADLDRRETRVRGESGQQVFIIFPVGEISIRTSLERAIESEPGCVALVDGSIKLHQRMFFPFIYADSKIVVEGTPLIDPARSED